MGMKWTLGVEGRDEERGREESNNIAMMWVGVGDPGGRWGPRDREA